MRLRKLGFVGIMVAMALVLVALPVSAANQGRNYACEAAGSTHITNGTGTSFNWSLEGSGECVGGVQGILTVSFTGVGKSDTLGLCSGGIIVQNLDLAMTLNYVNHKTGIVTTKNEHWVAGISTYPTVTPFLIESSPGNTVGAGALFDHIFSLLNPAKCPPGGGAASTLYAWAEQSAKAF